MEALDINHDIILYPRLFDWNLSEQRHHIDHLQTINNFEMFYKT